MGRTIQSFRISEHAERERWKKFRNALCRNDREDFDELFNIASSYTSSTSNSLCTSVFECIAFSILFEHYKKITKILELLRDGTL